MFSNVQSSADARLASAMDISRQFINISANNANIVKLITLPDLFKVITNSTIPGLKAFASEFNQHAVDFATYGVVIRGSEHQNLSITEKDTAMNAAENSAMFTMMEQLAKQITQQSEQIKILTGERKILHAFVERTRDESRTKCISIEDVCKFINRQISPVSQGFMISRNDVFRILREIDEITYIDKTNHKVIPTVVHKLTEVSYNPYLVDHSLFTHKPSKIHFTEEGFRQLKGFLVKRAFISKKKGEEGELLTTMLKELEKLHLQFEVVDEV